MDEKRAVEILHHLGLAIQKARSNIVEMIGGVDNTYDATDLYLLQVTDSILFPKEGSINLLEAITKAQDIYTQHGILERQVVFNILFLAHRSMALRFQYGVQWGEELPEPMWALMNTMESPTLKGMVAEAMKKLDEEMGVD